MKKLSIAIIAVLGLASAVQAQTCTGPLGVTVAGSTTNQPLTATETHVNSACNTGSTPQVSGSIAVTAAGGSPTGGTVAPGNYTYTWTKDGAAFTPSPNGYAPINLGAGSYMVTVTDNASAITATTTPSSTNFNCTKVVGPIVITEPTAIVPVATLTSNYNGFGISCALASTGNASNGVLTSSATGGTGAYTYAWSSSPAQTTAVATGLPFGTYTVTITDANGCSQTTTSSVTKPTNFTQTNSFTQPLCAAANGTLSGTQGGTATIVAAGGVTTYTYAWATAPAAGQTTATATGLGGGTYTVTATDANTCTVSTSYTLTEPTPLSNTFTVVLHNGAQISCATAAQGTINDGSITSAAAGGAATVNNGAVANSYSYAWSNSINTAVNATLTAGTYTVTITDGNACTMTALQTLVAPIVIATPGAITGLTCNQTAGNGGATGAVDLSPTGGTGALTYLWAAGGQTTQDISGLIAATYTVTVTDVNNCTQSSTFVVAQPNPITFTTAPSSYNGFGVSCNTGMPTGGTTNISNNGTITLSGAAGGNGTFTYSVGSAFQTGTLFSTLTPTTYTVTVKDGNNCTATSTQEITQPTMLVAGTCTAANDLCQLNTGQIKVNASGSVAPYNVTWTAVGTACQGTPIGTTAQVITTSGGNVIYSGVTGNCTYDFIVQDANGCRLPN